MNLSFNFLSISLSFFLALMSFAIASEERGPTDENMVVLAHTSSAYRNVVELKLQIPLPGGYKTTITNASGAYIGDNAVITAAHCLEPYQFFRDYGVKLYVSVENEDQSFTSYKVVETQIHPQWEESKASGASQYDIALLRLKNKIPDLDGLKPPYTLPTRLHEFKNQEETHAILPETSEGAIHYNNVLKEPLKELEAHLEELKSQLKEMEKFNNFLGKKIIQVGFGTNGQMGNDWTYSDGEKRAVESTIFCLCGESSKDESISYPIPISLIKSIIGYDQNFQKRDLLPFEGGARYGMSGGAVFLINEETGEDEFIGIVGTSFPMNENVLTLLKGYYQEYFAKYLSALRIPMPGINPIIGTKDIAISLTFHKDWIQNIISQWKEV
jgi:hypothetical protein